MLSSANKLPESTVLITAYAINPYKGSEDGMGWNFILQAARYRSVIAITRENNQPAIEAYMQANPNEAYRNIRFQYFDLPPSQRWWKKGGRGAMLYFYLWQRNVVGFIQQQGFQFDLVHNLNFHNDWTPTFLWKLNKPLVWGPVGHHSGIPKGYLHVFGIRARLKDKIRTGLKSLARKTPGLSIAGRHSQSVIGMNQSARIPGAESARHYLMPSVGTSAIQGSAVKQSGGTLHILSAGRLVALKGFDLTLHAFALFLKKAGYPPGGMITLSIIGSGPEEEKLKSLAQDLGVANNIRWVPWISRAGMDEFYKESDVFLFPSHEGAGMVVAEAMSYGLPVVCLDNDGPGELTPPNSTLKVPVANYDATAIALAAKLWDLWRNPGLYETESALALQRIDSYLAWNVKGDQLDKIYNAVTA